jgi:hypothetical protein
MNFENRQSDAASGACRTNGASKAACAMTAPCAVAATLAGGQLRQSRLHGLASCVALRRGAILAPGTEFGRILIFVRRDRLSQMKTSYAYIPGHVVRRAKKARHNHWQGGRAYHEGAYCRRCKRPLLLLWDFDCGAPALGTNGKPWFRRLERLALYYCWTCCGELDYLLLNANRLRVLKHEGRYHPDFPYSRYPPAFPRVPLEIERMDQASGDVKRAVRCSMLHEFTLKERRALKRYLGRPVRLGFDLWLHQLGGVPWLIQGGERIPCANPDCSWNRRGWSMKVLAVVQNDPIGGLPMVETTREVTKRGQANHWVQVVFHICKGCLSIHAANRCD